MAIESVVKAIQNRTMLPGEAVFEYKRLLDKQDIVYPKLNWRGSCNRWEASIADGNIKLFCGRWRSVKPINGCYPDIDDGSYHYSVTVHIPIFDPMGRNSTKYVRIGDLQPYGYDGIQHRKCGKSSLTEAMVAAEQDALAIINHTMSVLETYKKEIEQY